MVLKSRKGSLQEDTRIEFWEGDQRSVFKKRFKEKRSILKVQNPRSKEEDLHSKISL